MHRVVVTGLGALTPIGNDVEAFGKALKEGRSGAATITQFDASAFKTSFACEIKDLDIEAYFDKREARRLDKFSQYAFCHYFLLTSCDLYVKFRKKRIAQPKKMSGYS